ncbi:MAG: hypothetical protein ACRD3L_03120 [Terriglobales bacterium]
MSTSINIVSAPHVNNQSTTGVTRQPSTTKPAEKPSTTGQDKVTLRSTQKANQDGDRS